jgi:phospholipid/cholesterol/gamma-HCH transport system permease protein
MTELGADAWIPAMVGVSIIREIGPIITALICAGRIGSGIGAELGSMRVTEQIDAMEVSGTHPIRYLVVTRVLATTLMIPVLVLISDFIALCGSFLVENIKGDVSFVLYFDSVLNSLSLKDIIPSTIKTFFFGFAIGLVGCFKGYYCKNGTAGVGIAANTAVVETSMVLFVLDFVAVLLTDLIFQ